MSHVLYHQGNTTTPVEKANAKNFGLLIRLFYFIELFSIILGIRKLIEPFFYKSETISIQKSYLNFRIRRCPIFPPLPFEICAIKISGLWAAGWLSSLECEV